MFGPKELMVILVVLAIVLLVFGPKRIKSLGSELGNAIKGFRQAVRDKDAPAEGDAAAMESVAAGEEAAPAPGAGDGKQAETKQNV